MAQEGLSIILVRVYSVINCTYKEVILMTLTLPTGKIGFLLIDVDGPLNPFSGTNRPREKAGYRKFQMSPLLWSGPPLNVWLRADHGPEILQLAEEAKLEPVWATTWEDEANTMIGPRIGLPELPVIHFRGSLEWKFPEVLKETAGHPIAWWDDDFYLFNEARDNFLKARGDLPTLLHTVSPRLGLTSEDFDMVRKWATDL